MKKYLEEKRFEFRVPLIIEQTPDHPQSIPYESENVKVMFLPPSTISCFSPLTKALFGTSKYIHTWYLISLDELLLFLFWWCVRGS
jgi:hypothetical protein